MPRWGKIALGLVAISFTIAALTFQWLDNAAIEGYITDEIGPVVKASVEIRDIITGVVVRAESEPSGYYLVNGLRAGRYSLWARAKNHSSYWIPRITIRSGQTLRLDFKLSRTVYPTTMTY